MPGSLCLIFKSHFACFFWESALNIYLQAWWEWIKPADNELRIWLPQSAYVSSQPHFPRRDEFTLVGSALNFGENEFELRFSCHMGQDKGEKCFHAAGTISAQSCNADQCWWSERNAARMGFMWSTQVQKTLYENHVLGRGVKFQQVAVGCRMLRASPREAAFSP